MADYTPQAVTTIPGIYCAPPLHPVADADPVGLAIEMVPAAPDTPPFAIGRLAAFATKLTTRSGQNAFAYGVQPGGAAADLGRLQPTLADPAKFTFEHVSPDQLFTRAVVVLYPPPAPLAKEDLVLLARRRRLPLTLPVLWKTKNLANDLPNLTGDECAYASWAQRRRAQWQKNNPELRTVAQLQAAIREAGMTCSAGCTRGGFVDQLIANEAGPGVQLDEHQEAAVAHAQRLAAHVCDLKCSDEGCELEHLLICAGPGAGKTTTVARTIATLCRGDPELRLLALAFNVEAETTLRARLRSLGMRSLLIPKERTLDPASRGCAVLTFDKFAHQVCSAQTADDLFDTMGGGGVVPTCGASTHRSGKEDAAERIRDLPAASGFHVVVVDESQDVTDIESALVNNLLRMPAVTPGRPPRLIAAGDPRQEIYAGARWFSALWTGTPDEQRRVLCVNYRSRPEIVQALNAYSRAAFPNLHHDQVAVRSAAPAGAFPIEVILAEGRSHEVVQNIGTAVGHELAEAEPDGGYALVPVTLEKFRLGPATAAARQTVHEDRPGSLVLPLVGDVKPPNGHRGRPAPVYIMATAKRIKGTERDLVVVYGADQDYDLVVDRVAMSKLLFVMLSRARNKLVIVTRQLHKQRIKELMAPFMAAAGGTRTGTNNLGDAQIFTDAEVSRHPAPKLRAVPVAAGIQEGGFALAAMPLAIRSRPGPSAPHVEIPEVGARPPDDTDFLAEAIGSDESRKPTYTDADFVGCFVEAHVARALGHPLASRATVVAASSEHKAGTVETTETGELVAFVDRRDRQAVEAQVLAVGAQLQDLGDDRTPYRHVCLQFTALCGRPWTVSERLADAEVNRRVAADARALADWLRAQAPGCAPAAWCHGRQLLRDARLVCPGSAKFGVIGFETDVELRAPPTPEPDAAACPPPKLVVELKHCRELTNSHRRQAAVYAGLRGCPFALLVNTSTGATERVGATPPEDINLNARALQALSYARSVGICLARDALRPPPAARAPTLVAVDVETWTTKRGTAPIVVEIGAVAVSTTDWNVLGVFQRRAPGAEPLRPGDEPRGLMEDCTRLRFRRAPTPDAGDRLLGEFREWVDGVSATRTFAHWGGQEARIFGDLGPCVDVHGVFRPWLEMRNEGRPGNTSLGDAVQQLLPRLPFEAHQAYEDALATVGVLLACCDYSGHV